MDEREMLKQIRQSAEHVDIPDALYPDAIEQRLAEQQKGRKKHGGNKGSAVRQEGARMRRMTRRWGQLAAALVLVICGGAVFAVTQLVPLQQKNSNDMAYHEEQIESASDAAPEQAGQSGNSASAEPEHVEHSRAEELGDMYRQADGYGEIYGMVSGQWMRSYLERFLNFGSKNEEMIYDATDGAVAGPEAAASEDISSSNNSPAADQDYSATNLVTEGVDEGDMVKTDGDYIYTIEEDRAVITDIRDGALEIASEITPDGIRPSDDLLELYVENDTLLLVLQSAETGLERENDADAQETAGAVSDVIYWDEGKMMTTMIVYDISDRWNPQEVGRMTQDGAYETSRRIGNKVYLFTYYWLEMPDFLPWNAIRQENAGEWLPRTNGAVVGCDDIYLPEEGSRGLMISSVDMAEPEETLDSLFIVDGGASVYMSADTLYLYRQTYDTGSKTQIARFNLLPDGCIEPVEATTVKGTVRDTFALNEYEGYLRVLTTDWSDGDDVNYLYILNRNMELAGSLSGIAPGEEIYAARFFGDVGYFVTYRNTDPLFTVDLSDPNHPEIIGELKVSGFSEYLHPWDEDHLVGIGYETDAESGERLGLKLSMFNISDPANVTEEAKYVLYEENYSSALYEYKKVLVSPDKNIIGFASDGYGSFQYNVFSYENGSFTQKLAEGTDSSDPRGIYSQDTLYLLESAGNSCYGIRSYDMNNGFSLQKVRE